MTRTLFALICIASISAAAGAAPAAAQSLAVVWKGRTLVNAPRFSGVGSSSQVVAHRSGNSTGSAQVLIPGPVKPGRITLKYAAIRDDPLLAWREAVLGGDLRNAQRQVTVIVHDSRSREVARFALRRAWPSSYHLSSDPVLPGTPVAEVSLVFEGAAMRPGKGAPRAVPLRRVRPIRRPSWLLKPQQRRDRREGARRERAQERERGREEGR